jgi:hypothetical protein
MGEVLLGALVLVFVLGGGLKGTIKIGQKWFDWPVLVLVAIAVLYVVICSIVVALTPVGPVHLQW